MYEYTYIYVHYTQTHHTYPLGGVCVCVCTVDRVYVYVCEVWKLLPAVCARVPAQLAPAGLPRVPMGVP